MLTHRSLTCDLSFDSTRTMKLLPTLLGALLACNYATSTSAVAPPLSCVGVQCLRHPHTASAAGDAHVTAVPVSTIPTYQIVPNPLFFPEVDAEFAAAVPKRIAEIDAERVRYCTW